MQTRTTSGRGLILQQCRQLVAVAAKPFARGWRSGATRKPSGALRLACLPGAESRRWGCRSGAIGADVKYGSRAAAAWSSHSRDSGPRPAGPTGSSARGSGKPRRASTWPPNRRGAPAPAQHARNGERGCLAPEKQAMLRRELVRNARATEAP